MQHYCIILVRALETFKRMYVGVRIVMNAGPNPPLGSFCRAPADCRIAPGSASLIVWWRRVSCLNARGRHRLCKKKPWEGDRVSESILDTFGFKLRDCGYFSDDVFLRRRRVFVCWGGTMGSDKGEALFPDEDRAVSTHLQR